MKTYQTKSKDIKRYWHLVDVDGKVLGRVATQIAQLLMGKYKKDYVNNYDMGDYVVVINASKVEVTGRKKDQKVYYRHSGYPGNLKEITFKKYLEDDPGKIIEIAVSGMLPKNRLHKKRMSRLKTFSGNDHIYEDKFVKAKKNKKE
ncbi:50S ribosomal protein L13 [Candidatus Woesebacteria bacterium]|nr:50S ribosomal protein L13 [Candidatus Woesebacteria bacterium]